MNLCNGYPIERYTVSRTALEKFLQVDESLWTYNLEFVFNDMREREREREREIEESGHVPSRAHFPE